MSYAFVKIRMSYLNAGISITIKKNFTGSLVISKDSVDRGNVSWNCSTTRSQIDTAGLNYEMGYLANQLTIWT